ncbi:MAG: hypothetical protein KDC43_03245, partial [Saprospiraceae bacterium]|nr:hypothetical protein [Saprospiraceae bacterium]
GQGPEDGQAGQAEEESGRSLHIHIQLLFHCAQRALIDKGSGRETGTNTPGSCFPNRQNFTVKSYFRSKQLQPCTNNSAVRSS